MKSLRSVIALGVLVFAAASPARANFIYTFMATSGDPLTGSFTVTDTAVLVNHAITVNDITGFSFTIPGETFDTGTVSMIILNNGPIMVNNLGDLVPNPSGPDASLRFDAFNGDNLTLDFAGPQNNHVFWISEAFSEGTSFMGEGTFTHTEVGAAVPEPGSLALLVCGAAFLSVCGWNSLQPSRSRQRTLA